MSKCTIGLLLNAANLVYRIEGENNDLRQDESHGDYVATQQLLQEVNSSGYSLTSDKTNPRVKNSKGLAAACFAPNDEQSPVIIAFRGTDSLRDMYSNMNLTLMGMVEKNLREEAFSFYTKIKNKYPGREIVITGHSLGGHLAQYVGAKAYATEENLRKERSLHVRTFNTAPIDTLYGQLILKNRPGIFAQFCNYRLDQDLVSRLPVQNYYGNTYSFSTSLGAIASHPLRAMRKVYPDNIKNLEVGGINVAHRDLNTLKEMVVGIKETYAVHIKGQWFAKYRMGSKNKEIIDEALNSITEKLYETPPDFSAALNLVDSAKTRVSGPVSTSLLNLLEQEINNVKEEYTLENDKVKPASETMPEEPVQDISPGF